ncbi:MAG TPA: nickel-responsive transcriptional regulator NikR [Candidatus Marinimicrobia bacterium]|nr:nickel-responsive transcriptional regulator NikR [Candidatus Neomarinimicrobiota bacterium]
MAGLIRFGVSLPEDLLLRYDNEIQRRGYSNRSEALRDLIREFLVQREVDSDAEVVGTLTLIYDHHVADLAVKLKSMQHESYQNIMANIHFHLDQHNCLEVIVLRGRCSLIQNIAERLIGLRGVKHGKLTFTSTGKNLPGL